MVTADKETLKLLTLLFINRLDETSEQYKQASDILLTLMGISDMNGNLSQEYKDSVFWEGGGDGTPLRPSARAEISAMLPPELRHLVRPTS